MNNLSLAEMANNADYAAMSYGELLNTKIAYTYVLGIKINPLLKAKRLDEMAKFTKIYMTWMNAYDATRSEIMSLLEKEGMTDNHMYTSPAYKEDQTFDVVPVNIEKDNPVREETVLTLPEHTNTTDNVDESVSEEAVPETESKDDEAVGETPTVSSPEEETPATTSGQDENVENPVEVNSEDAKGTPGTEEPVAKDSTFPETSEQTLAEKALAKAKTRPLPDNIDDTAPYFVNYTIDLNDKGELKNGVKYGRNLDRKDLEDFRAVSEDYIKLFLKENVMMSTDDYLVYKKEGESSVKVRFYHIPEQEKEGENVSHSNNIPYYTTCDLNKTHRRMKKAIEKAKEYSVSLGSSSAAFYDRYRFHDNNATVELKGVPTRMIEDVDTLTTIKSVFETYARFFVEGTIVISEENCVAVKAGSDIYVVLFNFPNQNKVNAPEKKKRRTRKKTSENAIKEIETSEEPKLFTNTKCDQRAQDLIMKAINMTKNYPVGLRTDENTPFFVQHSFSVTNDGGLIYHGNPFSKNINVDEFDRYRKNHRKFAKTLKASATVSTDDYTAFIWNDDKGLIVFNYNTKGIAAAA